MALTDKLTAIGDAIRAKTGGNEKLTLDAMPTEIASIQGGAAESVIESLDITSNGTYTAPDGVDGYSPITVNVPQDGSPPESAFVFTGRCDYKFANGGWDWFVEQYGNKIITKDINDASYMFNKSNLQIIPFNINFNTNLSYNSTTSMFADSKIKTVPLLNNLKPYNVSRMFDSCYYLRNIPDNIADTWDWSYVEGMTSSYSGVQSYMFAYCRSLRSISMNIIKSGNPYATNSYSYFYYGFQVCNSLDELINLPIPYTKATWSSNSFSYTFYECNRLKNITFALQEDGTPFVVKWKTQTIDLSSNVGYVPTGNIYYIINYNSGITSDKEVKDNTTYQALKNDPDWFTANVAYSRYNHDSAVATINSLPDTSAYLAEKGGTNTIKFKGAAGSATDGGAINTLTEEEIAVATAKGWTCSFV